MLNSLECEPLSLRVNLSRSGSVYSHSHLALLVTVEITSVLRVGIDPQYGSLRAIFAVRVIQLTELAY